MTENEKNNYFQQEGLVLESFPTNSEVKDECGEINELNQCDYDKVKQYSIYFVLLITIIITISRVNTST